MDRPQKLVTIEIIPRDSGVILFLSINKFLLIGHEEKKKKKSRKNQPPHLHQKNSINRIPPSAQTLPQKRVSDGPERWNFKMRAALRTPLRFFVRQRPSFSRVACSSYLLSVAYQVSVTSLSEYIASSIVYTLRGRLVRWRFCWKRVEHFMRFHIVMLVLR